MKNVVITGSTRGVGLEMAKEFLKLGCNVTISGNNNEITKDVTNELTEFNNKYLYVPCNVRNRTDIEHLWYEFFNTLADKPETVASFFVPKILGNNKNDTHLVWLTNFKSMRRFLSFNKRKLI